MAGVGPIDPQIGLLRLDRADGTAAGGALQLRLPPDHGRPPSGGNTADYPGFASKVIEENLGDGAIALFVQGCGGDINPVRYKEVSRPADAEPLGNMLGLSVLRAVRKIATEAGRRARRSATRSSPCRAVPTSNGGSTRSRPSRRGSGTSLKADEPQLQDLPAAAGPAVQLSPDFPSHHSQRYLHDQSLGRDDLPKLDADNRANMEAYLENIQIDGAAHARNTNLALLQKHQARNRGRRQATLDVEMVGAARRRLRAGHVPRRTDGPDRPEHQEGSPHDRTTFVAGYTNGYIYYTPTAEQRKNTGCAQEDCDCLVAPDGRRSFRNEGAGSPEEALNPQSS